VGLLTTGNLEAGKESFRSDVHADSVFQVYMKCLQMKHIDIKTVL